MMFKITGKFKIGNGERPFSKQFDAENEKRAKDIAYSFFGNTYRMTRSKIIIDSVVKA